MKAYVEDSSKSIEGITIRLNSTRTNFRHITLPLNGIDRTEKIHPYNELMIFLDDSHEIDMLIDMLEHFKEINFKYFGEWGYRT